MPFTETLHIFKSGDKGVRLACKRGPEVEVYCKCWGRHGGLKEKGHVPEIFKRTGLQKVKGTEGKNCKVMANHATWYAVGA